ncbi:MAG TPA: GAF domain-containing protein, partial [Nannocystaceae bacterium]|nr:GAF domain-containing protein [Nannocystaceae bacterium]
MDSSVESLRVIADAMRAFTEATTDYRQLLDLVVERVATLVHHHCAIRLVSSDREHLELVAHYDVDPHARTLGERAMGATRLRIDGPHLTTRVMKSSAAFLVRDVDLDQLRGEVMPEIWAAMLELEVKSLLYVPLKVHRELIGVLSVARRGRDAATLEDRDVELVQTVADGAALAISNARLFAEARRQHTERRRAEDSLRMVEDARRF